MKRNILLIHTVTWMNLKIITLSERNQAEKKRTYCVIPFIYDSRKYKLICSDRKQLSGYWELGGIGRHHSQRDMSKLLGMTVMFTMLVVVMVSGMYVATWQTVHFKYVQFIKYQLYFNEVIKKAKFSY